MEKQLVYDAFIRIPDVMCNIIQGSYAMVNRYDPDISIAFIRRAWASNAQRR